MELITSKLQQLLKSDPRASVQKVIADDCCCCFGQIQRQSEPGLSPGNMKNPVDWTFLLTQRILVELDVLSGDR